MYTNTNIYSKQNINININKQNKQKNQPRHFINNQNFELIESVEIESDIPSFSKAIDCINYSCELAQRLSDHLRSFNVL